MFRKLLEISSFLFFAVFHLTEAEVTTYTHFDGEPVEGSNQCWRFTWVGDADETTDTNIGCDSFFPDDLCFEPIVFTNSSGSGGIGPDLVDLTDQCQSKNVTGDCKCDLSASEVCVKYTKFLKNGVPVYYSSFCGSGVNRNNFDTHAVTSGCHKDTNKDVGYDREVCFCKGNLCNGAHRGESGAFVFYLSVIFLIYLRRNNSV